MKAIITQPVRNSEGTEVELQFLLAVPANLRNRVRTALFNPRIGGRGLRAWLGMIATDDRAFPKAISDDLITIYLNDAEAEPLHDCEDCGLPIPVRAGRRVGHEPTCERVYFSACPQCGGRTGPLAFWSRSH